MGARAVSGRRSRMAAFALPTAIAAGCAGPAARDPGAAAPPRPDPRAEHALHMADAWRWLAARYDQDGDGRIVPAEHSRGATAFRHLDRDGDGAVTAADLARERTLPPELGIPLLLPRLYGGHDTDEAPIGLLAAALAGLDRDGDGRVDRAEFRATLGDGGPAGVDGFGTLLAGMDRDGDELLSAPEIAQWLADRDSDGDGVLALRERDRALSGPPPRVGFIEPEERELAPDFAAVQLADGTPVLRSALQRRRPMALIFGSFT